MERIAELLNAWAEDKGDYRTWELKNNSMIIGVEATSEEQFGTAAEAFAEGQRFVETLVDERLVLVNRVEIGAHARPIDWGRESGWRAAFSVVLSDTERLASDSGFVAISIVSEPTAPTSASATVTSTVQDIQRDRLRKQQQAGLGGRPVS